MSEKVKFVSDVAELSSPKVDRECYDTHGKISSEESKETCAKKVVITTDKGTTTQFFAKIGRGYLFNPHNENVRERNKNVWSMKTVNPEAFSLYVRFLKSRSGMLITQANRSL